MADYRKICINCPAGCHLDISTDEATGKITVSGNRCPRGKIYATQEITDPRRTVTTIVFTDEATPRCLPVKSSAPVPKQKIPDLMAALAAITVHPPVCLGEAVMTNCLQTGIDMVATDDMN